jgi:hypothetical protein
LLIEEGGEVEKVMEGLEELRAAIGWAQRSYGFAVKVDAVVVVVLVGAAYHAEPLVLARAVRLLRLRQVRISIPEALDAMACAAQPGMLRDREQRPAKQFAQWATATALRESYFRFAQYSAAVAVAFWVVALSLSLAQSVLGGSPEPLSGQAAL